MHAYMENSLNNITIPIGDDYTITFDTNDPVIAVKDWLHIINVLSDSSEADLAVRAKANAQDFIWEVQIHDLKNARKIPERFNQSRPNSSLSAEQIKAMQGIDVKPYNYIWNSNRENIQEALIQHEASVLQKLSATGRSSYTESELVEPFERILKALDLPDGDPWNYNGFSFYLSGYASGKLSVRSWLRDCATESLTVNITRPEIFKAIMNVLHEDHDVFLERDGHVHPDHQPLLHVLAGGDCPELIPYLVTAQGFDASIIDYREQKVSIFLWDLKEHFGDHKAIVQEYFPCTSPRQTDFLDENHTTQSKRIIISNNNPLHLAVAAMKPENLEALLALCKPTDILHKNSTGSEPYDIFESKAEAIVISGDPEEEGRMADVGFLLRQAKEAELKRQRDSLEKLLP